MYYIKIPGSGEHKRACNEIKAVLIVRAGVHSFFKMSKQIAPVYELIFGCHIFVSNFIYKILGYYKNFTLGGLKGYSTGISMSILKIPPS